MDIKSDGQEARNLDTNIPQKPRVLDCFQENTVVGRGNRNRAGRVANVHSAKDCQEICKRVRICKFFVWNSPEKQRNRYVCFLKRNGKNKRTNAIGRVSGPRTC